MATTKFHNNVGEIVPWQAQYTFPSQATKSQKQTVKLVPKNGSSFDSQNRRIRIEFPSDGYLNFQNSVLKFDLTKIENGAPYSTMRSSLAIITTEGERAYLFVPNTASNRSNIFFTKGIDNGSSALIRPGFQIRLSNSSRSGEDIELRVKDAADPTTVITAVTAISFPFVDSNGTADTQTKDAWKIELEYDDLFELRPKMVTDSTDSTKKSISLYSNKFATDSDGVPRYQAVVIAEPNIKLPDQGGHALIRRLRILYGGMVLEDIQEYSTLSKIMYDTTVSEEYKAGAGSLLEGTFHPSHRTSGVLADAYAEFADLATKAPQAYNSSSRQIILNCMSGILNSKKLFPLKWMAAQFAIEIELNEADRALISSARLINPNYQLSNVCYIAEIMDFDSSFDYAFLTGLKSSGVPVKFSSWHWYAHNLQSLTQAQIHERARSIKSAFSVVKDTVVDKGVDFDVFYHDANSSYSSAGITQAAQEASISEFQYRVGGKYHPAQPVDCTNGASEAYLELAKTINSLGDFTFSTGIRASDFSQHYCPPGRAASKFIMAMEFQNTDVFPDTISGINGEEQSDINLTVKTSSSLASGVGTNKQLWTFVNYDALLIVRDGNIVELIM